MNPVLPCPQCGKNYDFHENEVEGVADGRNICLQCGLELEEANFVAEVIAGKHPEFVRMMNEEGGEDGEGEGESPDDG